MDDEQTKTVYATADIAVHGKHRDIGAKITTDAKTADELIAIGRATDDPKEVEALLARLEKGKANAKAAAKTEKPAA